MAEDTGLPGMAARETSQERVVSAYCARRRELRPQPHEGEVGERRQDLRRLGDWEKQPNQQWVFLPWLRVEEAQEEDYSHLSLMQLRRRIRRMEKEIARDKETSDSAGPEELNQVDAQVSRSQTMASGSRQHANRSRSRSRSDRTRN